MTTLEVGNRIVEIIKEGNPFVAFDELYHPEIESHEAGGPEPDVKGIEAIKGKAAWFGESFEIHGVAVEGPYPSGDQFILHLNYDVTEKASGNRFPMVEAALYTVTEGKIVKEQFFYEMNH